MNGRSCLIWVVVLVVSVPLAWVVFSALIAWLTGLATG